MAVIIAAYTEVGPDQEQLCSSLTVTLVPAFVENEGEHAEERKAREKALHDNL
jgi:hypothetical protein